MAIIGKIRERGTLLGIVVGGALALFVVGDFIGNRGGAQDFNVGTIGGDEVSYQLFTNLVDEQLDIYRRNGTTVDKNLQNQVRNGVWEDMIRSKTLGVQADKAGFGNTISRAEYDDIRFGNNIMPEFRNNQNFMNPNTGQIDRSMLKQYFKSVQDNDYALFKLQERTFVPQRVQAKYNDLVKKSCFVNSRQVYDDWAAANSTADARFVAVRMDARPDSLYTVGESELRRYYDAHKNEPKYRQQPSRSFAYVQFNANPTEQDVEDARKEMEGIKKEWEEASSTTMDSALVMAYADTRNPQARAYEEGTADAANDALIINAQPGEVVGPYRAGNKWDLVKVTELADVEEARVRHILLSTQGSDAGQSEVIKNRADSLLRVVKRDRSKFDDLVQKFSDDPGSKSTGGVYEWFDRQRMVPEFTKASFDEPVGAITVVKSDFGYHVVEVLGHRTRQERRVLTIDRKIQPIEAMKRMWKQANEFALNHPDTASFRKAAEENGYNYTVVDALAPQQTFVSGLQEPDEVISWVNRAEKNDKPSGPLTCGDSYVVCTLLSIRAEGVPALNDARERFTAALRTEMKADDLVAKMQGQNDLDAISTELGGAVQTASSLKLSENTLPGGYNDPGIVGAIFALPDGATSPALKGDVAVYVVRMNSLQLAGEMPEGAGDAQTLVTGVRNQSNTRMYNALKEMVGVTDDRSRFF